MRTELDLAMTLLETASISGDPAHVARCVALAKQATRVVEKLIPRIELTPDDRHSIAERLLFVTAKLAEFPADE